MSWDFTLLPLSQEGQINHSYEGNGGSGTLDRRFSRKCTDTVEWLKARQIADEYEKAGSWTGHSAILPAVAEPAPEKARIGISDACEA